MLVPTHQVSIDLLGMPNTQMAPFPQVKLERGCTKYPTIQDGNDYNRKLKQ